MEPLLFDAALIKDFMDDFYGINLNLQEKPTKDKKLLIIKV